MLVLHNELAAVQVIGRLSLFPGATILTDQQEQEYRPLAKLNPGVRARLRKRELIEEALPQPAPRERDEALCLLDEDTAALIVLDTLNLAQLEAWKRIEIDGARRPTVLDALDRTLKLITGAK